MDVFQNVLFGLQVALQPASLGYCFLGVLVGTLVGVLPGLGPAASIAMLLPATYTVGPLNAVIMLAGIYYGAMYGGSTTSILVNIPGESASVVTCFDGHKMALKGRAGAALGIAAIGSFIAGTLSVIALTLVAPAFAEVALMFAAPEYFSMMLMSTVILTYLNSGSMIKSLMMATVGLILSGIGMDSISGHYRYTYNIQWLLDGVKIVPMAMGLFGISEIFVNLETEIKRQVITTRIKDLFPTLQDWRDSLGPIFRGSILGFLLGIIPGGAAPIASFGSYAIEKRISKHPEEFGKGAIQGVAGPEAANNAAVGGNFIPLLTLGIPTTPAIAILLGALLIHGVQPGPLLMIEAPEIFWGVILSMYVGNAMLLVLNLPLIPLWVMVLRVPYFLLYPLIFLFCIIGSYSIDHSSTDVLMMIFFGVVGYLMRKFDYDAAPLILGLVIGEILEVKLREGLILSRGDFSTFFTRPISLSFLIIAATLLIIPIFTKRKTLSTLKE